MLETNNEPAPTALNVRNPKYNQHGTIDCEVEHPEYGWIPFTASPEDTVGQGKEIYDKALLETYGVVAEYTPAVLSADALFKENNISYEKATQTVTGDYPQMEKDTWPTQDKESRKWVNDPVNAKTPWIDRAASTRVLGREEYIRRTLAKAYQFNELSAHFTGLRQYYEDQIKAGNVPTLDYTVPTTLYQELQERSYFIMTATIAELQEFYS